MKVFVAFACLIVCVSASGWNLPAVKLTTGTSTSSRTQDAVNLIFDKV
jgi:hypothetical protein